MKKNPEADSLRIGQFLSRAGCCSRRDAVAFLKSNQVIYRGERVLDPSARIGKEDKIIVNGKSVRIAASNLILLLNKPVGYSCSHREQRGQKSIFRLLPREHANIFFAGRLDTNSRGLVVLSYDGDLIYRLTHPSQETEKEYQVTLSRPITAAEMERALAGVWDRHEKLRFRQIEQTRPAHCRVVLTEGKNREIRRLFARLGIEVRDLQRVRMGDYLLPEIPEGRWQQL